MREQGAFWDYFWVAKFFLQATGILSIGGTPSLWKSVLAKFFLTFPLLCCWYLIIPEMNYIFFLTPTTEYLLEAVTLVIGFSAIQLRIFVVAVHRQRIERLFTICETLWDQTVLADYKVTSFWARRARLFSTAYFCFTHFMIAASASAGVVKQLSRPENSTIRYYIYHYPENVTQSPQYEIKFAVHVMMGHATMFPLIAADMTGTLLALNMCGQFSLIRSWLMDISKKDSTATVRNIKSTEQMLEKCIRRHQLVLEFCAELEEVTRYINLAQMIMGMYVFASCGAQLMKSFGSSRFFIRLMFSITSLFFSCWPGESLSSVSSEVANAVYEIPWYHGSNREKIAVAVMLARSQRAARLTAGKFVVMSLETFSSMVSSGISLCMVLTKF